MPPGDLIFELAGSRLGGGPSIIASKNTLGLHNAWGPIGLGSALAQTSLDPQNPFVDMDITYRTTPPPPTIYRENVDIFARDPREYADTIAAILNDPGQWQTQTGPCNLPDVLDLKYPTAAGGIARWGPPTSSSTFFSGCAQGSIDPSLSGPIGFGSVRAAYVTDRGTCSAHTGIDGVVPAVLSGLFYTFYQGVRPSGCADAEQVWSFGSSYLTENPDLSPDLNPTAGFDINFYYDAHIHLPGVKDANARFSFSYQWGLDDGIISVSATENGVDVNGGAPVIDTGKTRATFEDGLQNQVPQGISDGALIAQSQDLFAPGSAFPVADCDPTDYPLSDTTLQVPIGNSGCNTAISLMKAVVDLSGTDVFPLVGLNRNTTNGGVSTVDVLKNTIDEPDPHDPSLFHHWRCGLVRNAGGARNRCEYVVRARRLNAYPDEVELVWTDDPAAEVTNSLFASPVDNPRHTVNSALPVFFLALENIFRSVGGDGGASALATYGALCNAPINQNTRSFFVMTGGDQYLSAGNAFNCTGTVLSDLFNNLYVQAALVNAIAGNVTLFSFL